MNWTRRLEKDGEVIMQEGTLPDPYWAMVSNDAPKASIGTNLHRTAEFDGSWVKCSFTIEVQCPQTRDYMNQAAALLFETALGYVNQGMSHLAPGLPPVPFEPKPPQAP